MSTHTKPADISSTPCGDFARTLLLSVLSIILIAGVIATLLVLP